jgi:hypothetical protein
LCKSEKGTGKNTDKEIQRFFHSSPKRRRLAFWSLFRPHMHDEEANSRTASQEILRIFMNPKVSKSPPLELVLSQINPAHIGILKSILISSSRYSKVYRVVSFCHVCITILFHCATYPAHTSWFSHLNNTSWRVQVMKPLIVQFQHLRVISCTLFCVLSLPSRDAIYFTAAYLLSKRSNALCLCRSWKYYWKYFRCLQQSTLL